MRKVFISFALVAAFLGMAKTASADPKEIKLGTLAPKDSAWGKVFGAWATAVEEESSGGVKLTWSFGSKGDEIAMVGKMRSKELQGGAITATGLGLIWPHITALQLPGLFPTWAKLDTVRDKMTPKFEKEFASQGFVILGKGEMGTLGDCWDRFYVRVYEMIESIKIVRWCLGKIEPGPVLRDIPKVLRIPEGEAYVGIENPRGELGHYVVSDGGKVAIRCRVRGPSFCNVAVLEELMPGTLLADSIAIVGSTDVVIGETDR